jgi:hypothetical protein
MSPQVRHRWWPLLPAVLLGAWLCAPAAARASCGDYVTFGGKPAHGPPHAAGDGHPTPLPAPTPPCHGPSCSGSPLPLAPPPAPAPTGPHADEWGWLSTAAGGPESGPEPRWYDRPAPRPFCLPTSIFHPPRRAARPST